MNGDLPNTTTLFLGMTKSEILQLSEYIVLAVVAVLTLLLVALPLFGSLMASISPKRLSTHQQSQGNRRRLKSFLWMRLFRRRLRRLPVKARLKPIIVHIVIFIALSWLGIVFMDSELLVSFSTSLTEAKEDQQDLVRLTEFVILGAFAVYLIQFVVRPFISTFFEFLLFVAIGGTAPSRTHATRKGIKESWKEAMAGLGVLRTMNPGGRGPFNLGFPRLAIMITVIITLVAFFTYLTVRLGS